MKHISSNTQQTIEYISSKDIEFKSFVHEHHIEKLIEAMIQEKYIPSSVIKDNAVKGGSLELFNELFINENSNNRFCVDLKLLADNKYPIVNSRLKGDHLIPVRDVVSGKGFIPTSEFYSENYAREFQGELMTNITNLTNKLRDYQIHFVVE
ncbi:hypothetical protein PVK64_14750 [Aliivibrio sp. S4TY2]|uniref:Uncharacterized protein n=1 Tax=Aliivibrio finisterrensis TaxID=511998 RepID=A0A4Q5KPM8_9GAMM|nr:MULTISPECIES: hypothetical protein [Aliivibrio]MDD9157430.1 hypothetical protein [Aliivibrio sp. S4TY2]MDD9161376.1 hypothetical protein [Aliivibrio sp. S4TY1]MDD9165406.1 hypothetical protein [Aliivibrio sp. S4MY2]MDD9169339.1 hypothetical protein [Aliivibrio sp. S4MY4]MDD9179219.1 hypothetical protein [Aliivibrio sp. A6]